ncbi:P-loop containing nucleoside triphosphate hydrolase protein [Obelidium mucronatum]|nr:P-loop containing nucleoside triphosphate hydrolase protein [Obelidium mucronatum]
MLHAARSSPYTLKIVLVGDGASGKTSIARRFALDIFSPEYRQTAGLDIYKKEISVVKQSNSKAINTVCNIQIWDVGGQTITSKSATNYIHSADAILFVYDTTHIGSLRGLEDWIKFVYSCKATTHTCLPLFVLVATKVDLASIRSVKPERHQHLARVHGLPSFHVSSKTGDGVGDMFTKISLDLCGGVPLTFHSTIASNVNMSGNLRGPSLSGPAILMGGSSGANARDGIGGLCGNSGGGSDGERRSTRRVLGVGGSEGRNNKCSIM